MPIPYFQSLQRAFFTFWSTEICLHLQFIKDFLCGATLMRWWPSGTGKLMSHQTKYFWTEKYYFVLANIALHIAGPLRFCWGQSSTRAVLTLGVLAALPLRCWPGDFRAWFSWRPCPLVWNYSMNNIHASFPPGGRFSLEIQRLINSSGFSGIKGLSINYIITLRHPPQCCWNDLERYPHLSLWNLRTTPRLNFFPRDILLEHLGFLIQITKNFTSAYFWKLNHPQISGHPNWIFLARGLLFTRLQACLPEMGAADYNPGRRWCQWWKMRIRMIRMKRIMGGVKRMLMTRRTQLSESKESPTHPGSAPATKLRRPRAPLQASWVQSRQVPCHYFRDWAGTKRAV